MKLIRLKLNSSYKSLDEGFDVHFLRDVDKDSMWEFNPYCLVGRNGSGKSNLLEAMAAIFYHVECIYLDYRPEGFEADEDQEDSSGFKSDHSYPDAYELEYLTTVPTPYTSFKRELVLADPDYAHVRITKNAFERPKIEWLNRKSITKPGRSLDRQEIKGLLPDFIIGYSSGENEVLSLPFFKMRFIHFDEYHDRSVNQLDYVRPEARFVYADTSYSQAIFLANYLMQEYDVLSPFFKVLGIEKLTQFRIIIRKTHSIKGDPTVFDDEPEPVGHERFDLTELVEETIHKLQQCSSTNYFDQSSRTQYLDYFVTAETRKAFKLLFDDEPLSLFQSLQILLTLNLYEVSVDIKKDIYHSESLYVNETIPILPSDKRIARFKNFEIQKKGSGDLLTKSFSDGEFQYLHAIGICLLFGNSNSLFLLDEPETHLNPDWRSSFISVLKECLINQKEPVLQDLLITSHSPFIVSDCKQENVLVFKDGKAKNPMIETFGASVNLLTVEIFGKPETISEVSLKRLESYSKRFDSGEKAQTLIGEINNELGDSVEKIMLINRLLEKAKE